MAINITIRIMIIQTDRSNDQVNGNNVNDNDDATNNTNAVFPAESRPVGPLRSERLSSGCLLERDRSWPLSFRVSARGSGEESDSSWVALLV